MHISKQLEDFETIFSRFGTKKKQKGDRLQLQTAFCTGNVPISFSAVICGYGLHFEKKHVIMGILMSNRL